ncbi:hypothetical protein HWV62_4367 [Athelia sp. TMB]|nr:hypothetical protein HWV62_4367 [Athelia sp. TMB]
MAPNNPVKLPGFGLPLNFTPSRAGALAETQHLGYRGELFPNALDCKSSQLRLTPLREFAMMRFMNEITDKPGWNSKASWFVFDDEIVAKWTSEAMSASSAAKDPDNEAGEATDNTLSEDMIDYCICELRYKSLPFGETAVVTAYDGDVVKSDHIVSEELRRALKSAAAPLEQVGPTKQDWHPGSNGMVLDLVHPSLFPVVYGMTRILKDSIVGLEQSVELCGKGEVLPVPPAPVIPASQRFPYSQFEDPWSMKFQWLPCQVEFTGDDDEVKITSYINNLHPGENKALYDVIEKIIARAIVLWNHTLDPLQSIHGEPRVRIPFRDPEYGDIPLADRPAQEPEEDDWTYESRIRELTLIPPPVAEFEDPEETTLFDLRREFGEWGLQVIVKLANISRPCWQK